MSDNSEADAASALHLSLLLPSPRSRQARLDLRDPYEMHRTLSRAFPPVVETEPQRSEDYKSARCLFRIDETKSGLCVLVQSRIAPNWDDLPDGYVAAEPQGKAWKPRFAAGQSLTFRLRANPVVCRDKKRIALLTEAERETWLLRKISEAGGTLLRATVTGEDPIRCQTTRGQGVLLNSVRFDGVLTVSDPAALAAAVAGGIGPAKGFGFGLLSLARS